MIFYPVVFAGLYLLFAGEKQNRADRTWLWLLAGFSGLLMTHLLSCIMIVCRCKLYPVYSQTVQAGRAEGSRESFCSMDPAERVVPGALRTIYDDEFQCDVKTV